MDNKSRGRPFGHGFFKLRPSNGILGSISLPHTDVIVCIEQKRRKGADYTQNNQTGGQGLGHLGENQQGNCRGVKHKGGNFPIPSGTGNRISLSDGDITQNADAGLPNQADSQKNPQQGAGNRQAEDNADLGELVCRGSRAFPKSETMLNLLAICPSSISVKPDTAKRTMVSLVSHRTR